MIREGIAIGKPVSPQNRAQVPVGPGFTPGRPGPELPERKRIRLSEARYRGPHSYFLTLCTDGRAAAFRQADRVAQALAVLQKCADSYLFDIWAYCFMPDHLHLLVGAREEGSNLLAFMRALKQRSGYLFRSRQRLWQKNYYDHILRAGDSWESVARYIWMNPVRKGLCDRPED